MLVNILVVSDSPLRSLALGILLSLQYGAWFPSWWMGFKSNERAVGYYKAMRFTTAPLGLLYNDAHLCGPKGSLRG